MTEEKLKPCPFCGEDAVIADVILGCPDCLVTFSFLPNNKEQTKEAINKCNYRHAG